jgi:hypothetical protein
VSRYRKKPVVVEAVQWFPDPPPGGTGYDRHGVEYTVTETGIRTREGFMRINPGEWLITGIKGEKYPCGEEIFAATYEPAE